MEQRKDRQTVQNHNEQLETERINRVIGQQADGQ